MVSEFWQIRKLKEFIKDFSLKVYQMDMEHHFLGVVLSLVGQSSGILWKEKWRINVNTKFQSQEVRKGVINLKVNLKLELNQGTEEKLMRRETHLKVYFQKISEKVKESKQ